MHAYLIVEKDEDRGLAFAKKFSESLGETYYEFSVSKIDDVREINKFISLAFDKPVSLIIKDSEEASEEAMNAFLKNLEEPQENVRFILLVSSINKIIPTIISRCQIVKVTSNKQQVTSRKEIQDFMSMTVGEKFSYLDKIRKREEALDFIKELTLLWHVKLIKGGKNISTLAKALGLAQNTYSALNANGNVGLQLTNFAINLERI